MPSQKSLLWFRNDLRTNDNPALHSFYQQLTPHDSPAEAIFFISEKQWHSHDWADIKIDFIKRHANALVTELAAKNITLRIIEVDDFDAQVAYLKAYCLSHKITEVFANSEIEFNEQQRDKQCLAESIPFRCMSLM